VLYVNGSSLDSFRDLVAGLVVVVPFLLSFFLRFATGSRSDAGADQSGLSVLA